MIRPSMSSQLQLFRLGSLRRTQFLWRQSLSVRTVHLAKVLRAYRFLLSCKRTRSDLQQMHI